MRGQGEHVDRTKGILGSRHCHADNGGDVGNLANSCH